MPHSIHELWAVPLGFLLLLWAAFIVIGVKGLLFHREPPRNAHTTEEIVNAKLIDPDSGEVIRPPGVGRGCGLCMLFIFWPLFLASKIDEWLPPPKA